LTTARAARSGALGLAQHNLDKAQQARDTEAMARALDTIALLIRRGHADYAAWHEVYGLLEQRRRIVESERKRVLEMHQSLTVEQAMALMAQLVQIIKRNVANPAEREAIGAAIDALANRVTPTA
jgi:hypothetical protein